MARDGALTRPLTVKALEEVLGNLYYVRKSKVLSILKSIGKEPEGEKNE